jgi:3-hydroxybutyryl-CoA dehydrogenase
MKSSMKKITVIGAGTMGNGIAHVFAQHGYETSLMDVEENRLEKALGTIEKNLDRQIKKELIDNVTKSATLNRLRTFTNLREAVHSADLVVEAATEDLTLKLDIFKQMDQLAPKASILASNTSSISITKIAAVTQRPEQVIGMHFMNPVPVMKLVEVIRGYTTSDATTNRVLKLIKSLWRSTIIPALWQTEF